MPYDEPPWTQEFNSPFLGMSPLEVASLLRDKATFPPYKLERPNGDEIVSTGYCAILDHQSLSDRKTALLVRTRRELGENLPGELDHSPIVQCRMSWEDVEQSLAAWSIGDGSMEETMWKKQLLKSKQQAAISLASHPRYTYQGYSEVTSLDQSGIRCTLS